MADVPPITSDEGDPLYHPAVPSDLFKPPAGSQEAIDYATETLKEACDDCGCLTDELCRDVESPLAECHAAVSAACRSLVGESHAVTDQALQAIRKVTDKIVKDASDQVLSAASELSVNGVNYPYDVNLQRSLLAADPSDWLPLAVPAIQQFYAGKAAPSECQDAVCDDPQGGGGSNVLPISPPPPPPLSPPITLPLLSLIHI